MNRQMICSFLWALSLSVHLGCNDSDSNSAAANGGMVGVGGPVVMEPIRVELKQVEGLGWQMFRQGEPYYIQGAGGEGPFDLLADHGGNSGRLWGVDGNTRQRLDDAHRHGLTLAVGIWLEHSQKGFDYSNSERVSQQFEKVIAAVNQYKDHPAVLVWGLGNEMEGYEAGDSPDLWKHVESLAKKIKEIDPHHPTMTVVAEITDAKVAAIHRYCPSLDIVGINSYGGCATLGERYRRAGGTKPYVVTEFGPVGTWEVPKNNIDAIVEPTSTAKTEMYLKSYQSIKADKELCLGSYAFLWGNKQEGTATWFGMLLPNRFKTNVVDAMAQAWSGRPPSNLCPTIRELTLVGKNDVAPGEDVEVVLDADDPEGAALNAKWTLLGEADSYITGGDFQATPPSYDENIIQADATGAKIKLPTKSGLYRLYVEVDDGNKAAATANIPIRVTGADSVIAEPTPLPYTVYAEADQDVDYAPSGWMGNTESIKVSTDSTERPQAGLTCIKCEYAANSGWGGVVWQNPINDWGDLPGGKNFSGAKKMTFWARGANGQEKIKFGIGLLGREKAFFDTTKKEQEIQLSAEWQQFEIDLEGENVTRIKTPFFWVVESKGSRFTFYLDSIVIE